MTAQRLLAVEDNNDIAALICNVASEAGFYPRTANNCSFDSIYDSFCPDVIVLDIFMPDMDGFEVLQFLSRRRSKARIIILSGDRKYSLMAESMGRVLGLCIDANMAKPFRVHTLRNLLETVRTSLNVEQDASQDVA